MFWSMARTLNVTVHSVRREAFIEAAQRLIQAKGYEQMSVQDVLDALDASRGAFYHYFDSKQALLEAVVDRMVGAGMARVAPIVDDPRLPALRKYEAVFAGIQQYKAEHKALLLAILEVWISDSNSIVREKFRRIGVGRLAPFLATIIRQGNDEGQFRIASPDRMGRILVGLIQAFGDESTELFIARQTGAVEIEEVEAAVAANTEAMERILGIPAGSLTLIDRPTLHLWFG